MDRNNHFIPRVLAVPLFLALAMAFWPFFAGAQTQGVIRIATILAQTGQAATESAAIRDAVRLAAEQINTHGGLLGQTVEIVDIDNKSTAIGSMLAAKEALAQQAVAVVGPLYSSHAIAAGQVLQRAGVVMIAPGATAMEVTQVGDFIFRACFTDALQAKVLADYASQELKASKAAILNITQDVYSEGLADLFAARFRQNGGDIVARQTYLIEETDFGKQLRILADAKPDVLFVPGYGRDSVIIISQAREIGLTFPLLGGDGWSFSSFPLGNTRNLTNAYVTHWSEELNTPESKAFLALVKNSGPDSAQMLHPAAACGFDAVNLLFEAIRRARNTNPAAIRNALVNIEHYPGVTGSITFGGSRDPRKSIALMHLTPTGGHFIRMLTPEPLQ